MVNWSLIPSPRTLVGCAVTLGLLVLAGCQAINPVSVDASFVKAPEFETNCPTVVAVLPIEDGSEGGAAARHLTFIRQEVNLQLVRERFYSATTENWVDASLMGADTPAESILAPVRLTALAKASRDDGVFALRIEKWDESSLMADRFVYFEFSAAMVTNDGAQLWSGSIKGRVKAGGIGASPLGRDAAARSCAELAVRELLLRLPVHVGK